MIEPILFLAFLFGGPNSLKMALTFVFIWQILIPDELHSNGPIS